MGRRETRREIILTSWIILLKNWRKESNGWANSGTKMVIGNSGSKKMYEHAYFAAYGRLLLNPYL